jgi:hypothetical protein
MSGTQKGNEGQVYTTECNTKNSGGNDYKYSTISHLIDILGQLAPIEFLVRCRESFSLKSFLKIGRIAVSLSSSSDSELAPYRFLLEQLVSFFMRCLVCALLECFFSGATFGVEWWCECCDLVNFRLVVIFVGVIQVMPPGDPQMGD